MLKKSTFLTSVTLLLSGLGGIAALPAAADEAVVYDCYSASGRLAEEDVSQLDAIAFTLFGSRGDDGVIRGLGGECRPQEEEEEVEQQQINSDRSVDVTYVSSRSLDNDQVEVTWSYKGTNYTYTSEIDSYYIRNRREARPAREGERAALETAYQRVTNSSPGTEELRKFGYVPQVGQFAVVRNTYEERNSIRQFDAMVNDDRQRWIANCRTEQLFNASRQEVRANSRAIGDIVAFVCTESLTAQNPGSGEDIRRFGNMPGYGAFSVVRNTYYSSNAILEFDAIVVGQRQRWDANCRTGELFDANDRRVGNSGIARNVASFVCRDQSNN